jgi:hypothetical protein
MDYDIKCKPTIYKNNKYRSRLEARWAAFFDLIGWRYDYEPFDYNGWTPDFIIYGNNNVLIEIKPFIDESILNDYRQRLFKIKSVYNCLILDSSFDKESYGCLEAGKCLWDVENNYELHEVHWKPYQRGVNSEFDIGSALMSFDGMIWGDGGHSHRKFFININSQSHLELRSYWLQSGELTRFHYE